MQIKTKIVICHTADSKPVKEEVNSTVILPPLVFPAVCFSHASLIRVCVSLGKTVKNSSAMSVGCKVRGNVTFITECGSALVNYHLHKTSSEIF